MTSPHIENIDYEVYRSISAPFSIMSGSPGASSRILLRYGDEKAGTKRGRDGRSTVRRPLEVMKVQVLVSQADSGLSSVQIGRVSDYTEDEAELKSLVDGVLAGTAVPSDDQFDFLCDLATHLWTDEIKSLRDACGLNVTPPVTRAAVVRTASPRVFLGIFVQNFAPTFERSCAKLTETLLRRDVQQAFEGALDVLSTKLVHCDLNLNNCVFMRGGRLSVGFIDFANARRNLCDNVPNAFGEKVDEATRARAEKMWRKCISLRIMARAWVGLTKKHPGLCTWICDMRARAETDCDQILRMCMRPGVPRDKIYDVGWFWDKFI
jgi:hypothetical protein